MPVDTTTGYKEHTGNSSTVTAYNIPFRFLANDDIVVVARDANGVETTIGSADLTITGAGAAAGVGEFTTDATAYDATYTIIVYRDITIQQQTDFNDTTKLPTDSFENVADLLTMIIQDLDRNLSGGVLFDDTSTTFTKLHVTASDVSIVFGISAAGALTMYTGSQLASLMSISNVVDIPTAIFADATERTANVPLYAGQLGWQVDTGVMYFSNGVTAGAWALDPIRDLYPAGGLLISDSADTPAALTVAANSVPHRAAGGWTSSTIAASGFFGRTSGGALGPLTAAQAHENIKSEIIIPIGIACSDETSDLEVADDVVNFHMPYAFTLTGVRATVSTAPTGAAIIVDIEEEGTTILSTLLTIDVSTFSSEDAATPAVISDTALADDARISINIDQIGSTIAGAGLKVWLLGYMNE